QSINSDDSRYWTISSSRVVISNLILNFRLHQFPEENQRFLPTEVATLGRDNIRNPLLRNVDLSSAKNRLQADGYLHRAGQVRVIKFVGVTNKFIRHQLIIGAPEGMAVAGGKVCE